MTLPILFLAAIAAGDETPQPKLDPAELGVPFRRYTTTDAYGRTITFYVSISRDATADTKLPIALWIPGSGCASLFRKRGDQISGGLQNLLLAAAKGRVRVLAVEKPGVQYLDAPARPGSAEGASEEFLKEHTLQRWAEANRAAIAAAWTLPDIDGSRALAVGHSEGGIVAARLAATLSGITHVASLAGGGPTQLFSLAESRALPSEGDKPGDASQRVRKLYGEWATVQKNPDSITDFWLGHPHRRWTSFLSTSVTTELSRTKAKIFLAQGTRDTSVPPTSHDVLVAELLVQEKSIASERIEGADHGFRLADEPANSSRGMQELLGRVVDWFLQVDFRRK